MIDKRKQGKNNRAKGKAFEKRVEKDLESKGWIVIKFNKQVDLDKNELVTAKPQFNPFFKRIVGEGSGFPDFLIFRKSPNETDFIIQLVECKINGYLDLKEKGKVEWIKSKLKIPVFIASKNGREIKYE